MNKNFPQFQIYHLNELLQFPNKEFPIIIFNHQINNSRNIVNVPSSSSSSEDENDNSSTNSSSNSSDSEPESYKLTNSSRNKNKKNKKIVNKINNNKRNYNRNNKNKNNGIIIDNDSDSDSDSVNESIKKSNENTIIINNNGKTVFPTLKKKENEINEYLKNIKAKYEKKEIITHFDVFIINK